MHTQLFTHSRMDAGWQDAPVQKHNRFVYWQFGTGVEVELNPKRCGIWPDVRYFRINIQIHRCLTIKL